MLSNLKFPLLYVVEIVLWLPLLGAFYGAAAFLAAKLVASLDLKGKFLPAGWEAAVPNHGKFLQGYQISSHPVVFAATIVVLIARRSCFIEFIRHKQRNAKQSDPCVREHTQSLMAACSPCLL